MVARPRAHSPGSSGTSNAEKKYPGADIRTIDFTKMPKTTLPHGSADNLWPLTTIQDSRFNMTFASKFGRVWANSGQHRPNYTDGYLRWRFRVPPRFRWSNPPPTSASMLMGPRKSERSSKITPTRTWSGGGAIP